MAAETSKLRTFYYRAVYVWCNSGQQFDETGTEEAYTGSDIINGLMYDLPLNRALVTVVVWRIFEDGTMDTEPCAMLNPDAESTTPPKRTQFPVPVVSAAPNTHVRFSLANAPWAHKRESTAGSYVTLNFKEK